MGSSGQIGGFVLDGTVAVPEKSAASCALTSQGEWLCLAWTGTDARLNLGWSEDGRHFNRKRTLDHRSYRTESTSTGTGSNRSSSTRTIRMAPALAWTSVGACLAWTGSDRRLNVWNTNGGANAHIVLPERTTYAPGLASLGPQIALAWIGTDRRLNIAYGGYAGAGAGGFGPPTQVVGATSSDSPAVCDFPTGLTAPRGIAVAWRGTDRRLNLSVARGGPFSPPTILDGTSPNGPALCTFGQDLVLAWQGTDRRLNVMSWPLALIAHQSHQGYGAPGVARRAALTATSSHQPALTEYRGQLLIAWTGTDMRPNLARLTPV